MQRAVLIVIAVVAASAPALICHELAPAAPHRIWWLTSTVLFAGLLGLIALATERGEADR